MNIILTSGRQIALSALHQSRTYAGVLAGRLDADANKNQVERLLDEACRVFLEGCEPHLIPAVTVKTQMPGGWIQEKLPAVMCLAEFGSGELKRRGSNPYSSMFFAWFQDEFAMPIDPGVVRHIQEIDWEEFAVDWIWESGSDPDFRLKQKPGSPTKALGDDGGAGERPRDPAG